MRHIWEVSKIRQAIITIGMLITIIIVGITIMSINNKTIRKDELENAVATAVHQTVNTAGKSNFKAYSNNEEMMASFVNNLTLNINSSGEIKVDVYGVDCTMGLLSVEVTQTFHYITGKKQSISVRRTAIYE